MFIFRLGVIGDRELEVRRGKCEGKGGKRKETRGEERDREERKEKEGMELQ